MSQYGVPKDVRERILNHGGSRKGSVTESVYNRYEYNAEKRAALELWADVSSLISVAISAVCSVLSSLMNNASRSSSPSRT